MMTEMEKIVCIASLYQGKQLIQLLSLIDKQSEQEESHIFHGENGENSIYCLFILGKVTDSIAFPYII